MINSDKNEEQISKINGNNDLFIRDWIEDSVLGISVCSCCIFKEEFKGYKRRVICKICSDQIFQLSKVKDKW